MTQELVIPMSHNRNAQQWVLLGNASASEDVWGVRKINFPCGYMMPPGAYATQGALLERPSQGEIWAMAGFAVEINREGKFISKEEAVHYVAGYRPWTCVFHNCLVDELQDRGHTIENWDRGISIFHGLWRQASQFLGDLLLPEEFSNISRCSVCLEYVEHKKEGATAQSYVHDASDIFHFMSKFMTLSAGDIWVQGPLVAARLPKDVDRFSMQVGDMNLETSIVSPC